MNATMTVRMDEDEKRAISQWAEFNGMSASEFMRRAALEAIEDEIDLQAYQRALAEFEADPVTYSMAEVREHLGL